MAALRQSQGAGSGIQDKTSKEKQTVVMFLARRARGEPPGRRIRELLGLDPVEREFTVVYGSFPEPDTEIAILTRSILQILIDLASQIDVPAVDIAEGRVYSAGAHR